MPGFRPVRLQTLPIAGTLSALLMPAQSTIADLENADETTSPEADIGTAIKPTRRGPGTYDRTQTTEERREEQRRSLVSAAARVFARDGLAKASVAAILDESGLSRGTFYRHFRDIEEVFGAVQREAASVLYERLLAAYESHDGPVDRMRAAIRAYLTLLSERSDLSWAFLREARVSGDQYVALRRNILDKTVALFQRGGRDAVERGIIDAVPDDLMVYAMVVAIEGVGMRYLEDGRAEDALEAAPVLEELCFKVYR
jgi:AcrR family transcriptional regulator